MSCRNCMVSFSLMAARADKAVRVSNGRGYRLLPARGETVRSPWEGHRSRFPRFRSLPPTRAAFTLGKHFLVGSPSVGIQNRGGGEKSLRLGLFAERRISISQRAALFLSNVSPTSRPANVAFSGNRPPWVFAQLSSRALMRRCGTGSNSIADFNL